MPTTSDMDSKTSPVEEAKKIGRELKDEALAEARNVRDAAQATVEEKANAARESVAAEVGSVSSALRRASSEMREGSTEAQLFSQAANSLADLAETVRGKSLSEVLEDVSQFGRRNPIAFLGGAALLGFAGARLARASKRDSAGEHGDHPGVPAQPRQPVMAQPVPVQSSMATGVQKDHRHE